MTTSLFKPEFDVRAKVRIGVKTEGSNGKEFPQSVDYFLSADPEFKHFYPGKPKALRIRFPFATAEENFSTGIEWWRGKQLTCYSKGDGTALRVQSAVDEFGGDVLETGIGRDRCKIVCRFRECPQFGGVGKQKKCGPMGRLQFFLDGGQTGAVLQLDTHSWNTIERLTAALAGAALQGDLRGRVFELTVAIEQKGNKKFPVLGLTEVTADVPINNEQDVEKAEALALIERGLAAETPARQVLAAALDLTNPGWRDNERVIERIKEVGPETALKTMRERLAQELGPA